ncbi:class I SAM-dependent methyltransferase [Pseudomonadota bacterium]
MSKYDAEYHVCPVCGADGVSLYHQDFRDNDIYICQQCSVQFMNPVYSDSYLAEYYAGYYGGGTSDPNVVEGQARTNRMKFKFIDKFVAKTGRALDFGCGNANFALFAKDKGWDVVGYDIDCEAMQQVSSRYGMQIACGPLADVDWQSQKFDMIHAHHVVEHLKQPVHDLKILHELLADDGCLYIGVPNIHAWSARVKLFLEKVGLKKRDVGKYYDSDHHVFYYTPKSMKNLLEASGFEVMLSMNGAKSDLSDNPIVQFFCYYLPNCFYSNSAFFVIARKK